MSATVHIHPQTAHFAEVDALGLDEANAVRDVKRIRVRVQADERLLLAIRADQGVNPRSVHVVHLLQGRLDLALVGLAVNNEHERVHVLDLLHRALGGHREQQSVVRVEARRVRRALAGVPRVTRETQRLGAVERHRGAHLAHTLLTRVALLDDLLSSGGAASGRLARLWKTHVSICTP